MFRDFGNLSKSPTGKIIIACILGLGLATLFRSSCKGKDCIQFVAPAVHKISKTTYAHGSSCYRFTPKSKPCTSKVPVLHPT